MPFYDYRCGECTHEFEVLQGVNDERLSVCPECSQAALKRLVSAPAFSFKGSGWYKDLYGSAGSAKPDSVSTPKADDSSTTKTSGSESTATAGSEKAVPVKTSDSTAKASG